MTSGPHIKPSEEDGSPAGSGIKPSQASALGSLFLARAPAGLVPCWSIPVPTPRPQHVGGPLSGRLCRSLFSIRPAARARQAPHPRSAARIPRQGLFLGLPLWAPRGESPGLTLSSRQPGSAQPVFIFLWLCMKLSQQLFLSFFLNRKCILFFF